MWWGVCLFTAYLFFLGNTNNTIFLQVSFETLTGSSKWFGEIEKKFTEYINNSNIYNLPQVWEGRKGGLKTANCMTYVVFSRKSQ